MKVKPPSDVIEQAEAKKAYEKAGIKLTSLTDRTRHVVQSCFGGKRIVIFSGGEAKGDDEVLGQIRELNAGGAFGSIMGRNAFQRPRDQGVKLLREVMAVFKG